jgi:lipoprotein-anchoring transpeptidase ErfK/SrfK
LGENHWKFRGLTLVNAYLVCNTKSILAEDSRMTRVSGHGAPILTGRFFRIAILTAAGAIGTASQADAALYYWSDSEPGFSQSRPAAPPRRPKVRRQSGKKIEAPEKESAKPQGPLIIAISIEKQNLKVYDANGFFAETPVSTGMKGHSTPMGVFSIIQKHKLHHSNIYSGAPMPFMQRITWSGIAMHAGVLPGYPASHGCIRMPTAFAARMWNWTKMGARVVVTPGEMTPAKFSHPLLVAQKVVPQPIATDEPKADTPPAAKADRGADAAPAMKPATSEASLELRPTVGHGAGATKVERTHTADASGAMPVTNGPVIMSDAAPSAGNATPREDTVSVRETDASNAEAKPETAKSEAEPVSTERTDTASSDDKPVETKSPAAAVAETPESGASDAAGAKPDEVQAPAQASNDPVKAEATASTETKADEIKVDAKTDEVKTETLKADAPASSAKDDSVTAAIDASQNTPVQKDQARLPDIEKPGVAKPEPPKRTGQIAVFISRKDAKLYVRQNFMPLFDVPVTIAPSDRPLGTHVFTVQVDKGDANVLHWSVVSLPTPARYADRRDEDERASRRRKVVGAVEMKPLPVPNSPAEALDRLTIPADAMTRITEALSTGGSIVVSDQGIGGETGEGTDFIVSLR